MLWRIPRRAQTAIPCKDCETPLLAERTCHEVFLSCPTCGKSVDVAEYLDQMDDALEEFIGNVPCDRT